MISADFILSWRASAPWVDIDFVEQELIISRALVELFSHPQLQGTLAFRGGTALNKLYFKPATRYSEDIDLVQITAGPIGATIDAIKDAITPWLGEPKRKFGEGRASLLFSFISEEKKTPMKLKVEINTREHGTKLGFVSVPFFIQNGWFKGKAEITTYKLEELLGTKIRAL